MNHYPSPTSKYLATFGLAASPVTPPMDGAAAGNSGSQKSSAPALAAAGKTSCQTAVHRFHRPSS